MGVGAVPGGAATTGGGCMTGAGRGVLGLRLRRPAAARTVLGVAGDLDRFAGPTLDAALRALLCAATPGDAVVVDLAGVPFVDLGGVDVLLGARQLAGSRGVAMPLRGCPAQLLRLLGVLGRGADDVAGLPRDRAVELLLGRIGGAAVLDATEVLPYLR
jgi:anti-anti-sigma regulatory factor